MCKICLNGVFLEHFMLRGRNLIFCQDHFIKDKKKYSSFNVPISLLYIHFLKKNKTCLFCE